MKKKQIIALGVIILAFAAACTNPFFPEKRNMGGDNTETISITDVAVTVTAPVKDAVPNKTAQAGGEGYTCGDAAWSPDENPFQGGTVYTVTVTLAAEKNYIFAETLDAKINGANALVTNNTGAAVTLSLEFDPTLTKTVTDITVTAQPTKLAYTHGDLLDLSGLVVTLAFDDGTDEEIALANFGTNITTVPADGAALSRSEHNGESVEVTFGDLTANTNNLTVEKANPVVTWPTGLTAVFGQTLSDISLASYTNGGTGTFSWDTPSDSVGALGIQSHSMTFTSTDTNYNTVTDDVTIRVLLGVEMVQVSGGSFEMGQNGDGSTGNVTPVHTVTLSGFYMSKYQVTQAQYEAVTGSLPSSLPSSSYGVGDNYPVYYVSWYDALVFCNKLSMIEGLTPAYSISGSTDPDDWGTVPTSSNAIWNAAVIVSGSTGYRLPTEAQWEYAAKGGDPTAAGWVGYTYAGSNNPDEVAWYNANGGSNTKVVGTKAPNGLGIYDMSGNVWEWCWDWYGNYLNEAQTDPVGASSGSDRVFRGGYWYSSAVYVRSAYRYDDYPYIRGSHIGFRLLRP